MTFSVVVLLRQQITNLRINKAFLRSLYWVSEDMFSLGESRMEIIFVTILLTQNSFSLYHFLDILQQMLKLFYLAG